MNQKVSINVGANLDTSQVEQRINALGQKVAESGKVQFNPVSVKTLDQLNQLEKKFQQLLKVHGELARRMKATGQEGRGLGGADFDALFPDAASRNRQLHKVLSYTLGAGAFTALSAPPPGGPRPAGGGAPPPAAPPPHPSGGGSGIPGMLGGVAQAGLRATGPVGGLVSNSVGAGMSAGFGAGLMGLLGGMLAMGVGKLVSGVLGKVDQAEDNNVALDRLKRTLGDVNVSFDALKAVVNGSAEGLKITYAEAGRLGQQFAQQGNMKSGEFSSLAEELGTGVGLSRSFGLDPEQGVGVMAQLRGIGVTKDTQDSRRFALLIGETIAKSDAFAKAGEVMDSLSSFAVSQTRQNISAANVRGYAGMFSSMVGSGIPGMDPTGASSMLARINAALTGGGAKGEASQFFTGMLGTRLGLNPYQLRMFREGGAFATQESMFGDGSAYARYKGRGMSGVRGKSTTFLQSTLEQLRQQYGAGSDELADATANHLGIGINQAMALLTLKPKQMGEMGKYANVMGLNAAGIGNLSKVVSGSDADRRGVADSLMRRSDVTEDEKNRIKAAMGGGDSETQKRVLAEIVAQRDQEQTTGKDVRDSKNALDNIKTSIADKLVPYFNEARMGIMAIAGVGRDKGVTTDSIMRGVIEANSKARQAAIDGRFAPEVNRLTDRQGELENRRRSLDPANLRFTYRDKPEVLEAKLKERDAVTGELAEIERRLAKIQEEKAVLLEKENAARKREYEELDERSAKRMQDEMDAFGDVKTTGSIGPAILDASGRNTDDQRRLDVPTPSVTSLVGKGPRNLRNNNPGNIEYGAFARAHGAVGSDGRFAIFPDKETGSRATDALLTRYSEKNGLNTIGEIIGRWAPPGENDTKGYASGVAKRLGVGVNQRLDMSDPKIRSALGREISRVEGGVSAYVPTPDQPSASLNSSAGQSGATVQVEVIHKNERGQEIAPRQHQKTRLQNNWRAAMGY
jgi:hypothetical protein